MRASNPPANQVKHAWHDQRKNMYLVDARRTKTNRRQMLRSLYKQDDFDISVDGNVLTIKGERKAESEVKDKDYYRCELSYGKFSRSIALPSKVRAEKVEADYDDGILEITLPKATDTKHKKIAVKAKKVRTK